MRKKFVNVTRRDLVNTVSEDFVFPKEIISSISNLLFGQIKRSVPNNNLTPGVIAEFLLTGAEIQIRDFGTFYVSEKKQRPARNLVTGETVMVPKRKVPYLRFSNKTYPDKRGRFPIGGPHGII